MSKGDWRRPQQAPDEEVAATWERVFGKKKLNIMTEEERAELEREKDRLAAETVEENDGGGS